METKTLSYAIKRIAVSYIFIYFSINLWTIDILPQWLGYFMIVSVLPIISEQEQSAKLIKPFGIALGAWNIIEWVLKILNEEFNLTIISLIIGIITIYFHFQLITNIASLDIEQPKRKRLITLRTVIVILHTLLVLWLFVPKNLFDEEIYTYIIMFTGISQVILCIWIACELFGLAKAMREEEIEVDEYIRTMENNAQGGSEEENTESYEAKPETEGSVSEEETTME